MPIQIRRLKDKGTGTPFVPITHWDAVSGKPSNLVTMTELNNGLSTKQNVLTPGENISIDSAGTISVVGISGDMEAELERISFVTSLHINALTEQVAEIEDDLDEISYVTSLQLNSLTNRTTALESDKQNALTPGEHITIDSAGTIDVTGIVDDTITTSTSTYSSSKITELFGNIASFDVEVVDTLPETGQEHTIYFVPSKTGETGQPENTVWLYDESGVTTLDWFRTMVIDDISSKATQILSSLTVGDIFKYVKDNGGIGNDYAVREYIDESGNTVYQENGGTTSSQSYTVFDIGTTFRVTNVNSNSVAFTSVNNPSYTSERTVSGVESSITLENSKVYRLTGYVSATYPEELDTIYERVHRHLAGVYIVTYDEVSNAETADYEVENIPSIQIRVADIADDYIVPSAIDKSNLLFEIGVPGDDLFNMSCRVVSGVTSTITLEDGHYYQLIDRYFFKANQIGGFYASTILVDEFGWEIFVFKEVNNPTIVKYNGISFVPGGMGYAHHNYQTYHKSFLPVIQIENTDLENSATTFCYKPILSVIDNYFPQFEIGDIVRVTGENTGYDGNLLAVIENVDDDSLIFNEQEIISGITNASIWDSGDCYQFTGYHYVKNRSGNNLMGMKYYIPTFEPVSNSETPDYEVETLLGMCIGREKTNNVKEEWMWIDDDWELIGTTKIDLSDYVTTEQLEDALENKQDVISDLSTIRSGAALGTTALQNVPTATTNTLGGVKVGSGLTIDNSGILSVNMTDNNLNTTDKTLVGAINELLTMIETLETRLSQNQT